LTEWRYTVVSVLGTDDRVRWVDYADLSRSPIRI